MLGRYGGFSADMFLAEDRLLVRNGRQRPRARTRWADIRVDVHVDQAGLAQPHRVVERALEILRARDRQTLHSRRARPRREIRVVGLALRALVERGAVLAAPEIRVLQVADRRPGE